MKSRADKIAPNLPVAAEKPCAKPRTRDGNTSAGIMKVVAFGPKLKKNYIELDKYSSKVGRWNEIMVD